MIQYAFELLFSHCYVSISLMWCFLLCYCYTIYRFDRFVLKHVLPLLCCMCMWRVALIVMLVCGSFGVVAFPCVVLICAVVIRFDHWMSWVDAICLISVFDVGWVHYCHALYCSRCCVDLLCGVYVCLVLFYAVPCTMYNCVVVLLHLMFWRSYAGDAFSIVLIVVMFFIYADCWCFWWPRSLLRLRAPVVVYAVACDDTCLCLMIMLSFQSQFRRVLCYDGEWHVMLCCVLLVCVVFRAFLFAVYMCVYRVGCHLVWFIVSCLCFCSLLHVALVVVALPILFVRVSLCHVCGRFVVDLMCVCVAVIVSHSCFVGFVLTCMPVWCGDDCVWCAWFDCFNYDPCCARFAWLFCCCYAPAAVIVWDFGVFVLFDLLLISLYRFPFTRGVLFCCCVVIALCLYDCFAVFVMFRFAGDVSVVRFWFVVFACACALYACYVSCCSCVFLAPFFFVVLLFFVLWWLVWVLLLFDCLGLLLFRLAFACIWFEMQCFVLLRVRLFRCRFLVSCVLLFIICVVVVVLLMLSFTVYAIAFFMCAIYLLCCYCAIHCIAFRCSAPSRSALFFFVDFVVLCRASLLCFSALFVVVMFRYVLFSCVSYFCFAGVC